MFKNTALNKEESWFLGLFHTDGYFTGKQIKVELVDKDVVEKLRNISGGSDVKLYNRNDKYFSYYYRYTPDKDVDLVKLNIYRKKSFTITLPEIELSFPDYLRGVVEGDGYFGRYKQTRGHTIKFSMSSASQKFIEQLHDKLYKLGFETNIVKRQIKDTTMFLLNKAGPHAVRLLDYIYENSSEEIRMNRKYNKYLEIKEALKSHKRYNKDLLDVTVKIPYSL